MLRFLTSGESHGKCLIAIVDGMVAGLTISEEHINRDLVRRQEGYGRGGRMTIEKDHVEILSGVRFKKTIGGPIALLVPNRDFKINELPVVKKPRPGHADLVGALKCDREDVRDILERASARETAARVAVGGVCRAFLAEFGVSVISHVVNVGGIAAKTDGMPFEKIQKLSDGSPLHCADKTAEQKMMRLIDRIKSQRDTLGGIVEVRVKGVVPGLGSFAQGDRRLSAKLMAGVGSIQAVKGVEIGLGFGAAVVPGSKAHDEIYYDKSKKAFYRKTNRAGGFEGGMTTGQEIVLRAAMKPISTLLKPLHSVEIDTKKTVLATVERSDVTAVPACGVIAEAMVAFELASAYVEKFGGDSLKETLRNYNGYRQQIKAF